VIRTPDRESRRGQPDKGRPRARRVKLPAKPEASGQFNLFEALFGGQNLPSGGTEPATASATRPRAGGQ
jgi:hypothetical protein